VTYLKLTIRIPDPYHENLIAELLDLDFEGFEQLDNRLEAYIPKSRFNDVSREYIEQVLMAYPAEGYVETEEIEEKNWNETWEKTIQPQSVGRFFIKPTWSSEKPPSGHILLEIDPKLSFGTGYHATTRLILEKLSSINLDGKSILDAGTGTGVLAIAAAKMGAKHVFAFDIDEWSKINATENVLLNQVE
jgi:ribosomal protein L11 methyltransferase